MRVNLYSYQRDAVERMKKGCILCGDVGSGKSRTSLAYYYKTQGGNLDKDDVMMRNPCDLYIITTAKKRDNGEWEGELNWFVLSSIPENNYYKNKVVIDSWNNLHKYATVEDAFFILDEQRLVGWGAWTKAFFKIAKHNHWILLSATPGDTWMDYGPVFVANGFYKNKTEFVQRHVVYDYRVKFPKISRYDDTGRLIRLKKNILIEMDYHHDISTHHEYIYLPYDRFAYKAMVKGEIRDGMYVRWDPYKDKPVENASEFCGVLRRIVNEDESKQLKLLELMEEHPRVIIFYNFNYELDILREVCGNALGANCIGEWNGQKHTDIPATGRWAYLVQYNAGSEGWNCTTTDTIIFFSENHSYKKMHQSAGRINRVNTRFQDLYYYHLTSKAPIDISIARALSEKKDFNEGRYYNRMMKG